MSDDKEKHIGTLCSEDNGLDDFESELEQSPDPSLDDMTDPCMHAMNHESAKMFRKNYPERLKAWGQIYKFSMEYLGSIGMPPDDAAAVYNMAKEKLGLPKRITPSCRHQTHSRDELIDTLNKSCITFLGNKKQY
ncbi:hypothetical protein KY349_00820 [Candidatus Woesearchaeota archaeon]|nr:hypothetical protein [Candidatus Woesearchaeota archaeon]